MGVETHAFKSEARQLLDLMIHSLYSNKEIFLRELISNASDALDKLRYAQLTDEALRAATTPAAEDRPLGIRIWADADARTLIIDDNGIGMSREDAVRNLGTIAHSGTREFNAQLAEARSKNADATSGSASAEGKANAATEALIGQFGVGFYSSFMVANAVTVVTRKAGEETATRWYSTGDGNFTVEEAERAASGTTITLHLRPVDTDNGLPDLTQEWTLRGIIKKYSDFVTWPVQLQVERAQADEPDEDAEDEAVAEAKTEQVFETVNSMKAIWTRDPADVTAEEYAEFYKHIAHDWEKPFETITLKAEGSFEYRALLFVPGRAPYDMFYREQKYGLQLYVNKVLIEENNDDLLPEWLRFVKGVVDSPDLSLNVSREILQKDRRVANIRKKVTRKVLDTLGGILKEDRDRYLGFYAQYGRVLKEGTADHDQKDRVTGLLLFNSSTQEGLTTLDEYVARMKEGQEAIYYITADNIDAAKASPHLEAFNEKGYEVLYLVDNIDEIMVGHLTNHADKPLRSVGKGEVELGSEDEKKAAEETRKEKQAAHQDLFEKLQSLLSEHIKEVRISNRLKTSAVVLVAGEHDLTPGLERLLAQAGQAGPKTKRILELNPEHPVLGRLQGLFAENPDDARLGDYARLLHGQALIAEGQPPVDPAGFARLVAGLMA